MFIHHIHTVLKERMFSFIIFSVAIAIGVWMGYFNKKAFTNSDFFKLNPKKVLRNYMITFVVAVTVSFILSYIAQHMLTSGPIPEDNLIKYKDYKSIFTFSIYFFFIPLLIFANTQSLVSGKVAWVLYLLTFLFAALFIAKDSFILLDHVLRWMKFNHMQTDREYISTTLASSKAIIVAMVVAFNAAMMWWGMRK
jgi:uncharacterized protein YacL